MCQGLGPDLDMPTGTNTLFFIHKKDIPKHKKPTYVRVVCAYQPEKSNPRRVRWTAGGDHIDYPGDVTTKTADITTAKLLFNSVISTDDGRFMTIDLKDFYLMSDLDDYEYVRIPKFMTPQQIIDLYDLKDKFTDGFIYAEVRKGMYGLPQAGCLANLRLEAVLKPQHGYVPCPVTSGLWTDLHSDLMFSLVVDDFGVRYTDKHNVERLLAALHQEYNYSIDWDGTCYIGLTLEWDYKNGKVFLSMPGYIERALQRFEHFRPTKIEHSPHDWTVPKYGARQQYVTYVNSPLLDAKDKTRVQEVLGTSLYYARAVDRTMLAAIGSIATQQSKATELTMQAITKLFNYCSHHYDAVICYQQSDMILYVKSNASYLSETKARSRFAGFHYLSSRQADPTKPPTKQSPMNGAIKVPCKILKEVLSSASEAKCAGHFHNAKEAVPKRITLEELGHSQPPTPLVTDNSTASGITNESVKQKRSKAMDMRFYWVGDRVRQGQFLVYWRRGITNRADYFTKHQPNRVHRDLHPVYLHEPNKNYYAPLTEETQPAPSHMKVPTDGEGVLIPTMTSVLRPYYARRQKAITTRQPSFIRQ
jgi:hypothetical protein